MAGRLKKFFAGDPRKFLNALEILNPLEILGRPLKNFFAGDPSALPAAAGPRPLSPAGGCRPLKNFFAGDPRKFLKHLGILNPLGILGRPLKNFFAGDPRKFLNALGISGRGMLRPTHHNMLDICVL